jgi:uncharacterized protein with NRDE domain
MFNESLENQLNSICIDKEQCCSFENYATRTHTILIVDKNDNVTFVECDRYTKDAKGDYVFEEDMIEFSFKLSVSSDEEDEE